MTEVKETESLTSFVFGDFTQRLGAYLIDILLIKTVSAIFLNIYGLFGLWDTGAQFGLYNISKVLLYLLYFMIFTKVSNGQTLGKMVFGLRVVSFYNEKLTWNDVFIREFVGRFIQKKIKILYFVLFITQKKQTLADIFTDTSVISEMSYLDLERFLNFKYRNDAQTKGE